MTCQTLGLTVPGSDYVGKVTQTKSGKTCQRWEDQRPHAHDRPKDPHNECRNPDNSPGGAWCFTIHASTRWEYCDQIPGFYLILSLKCNLD